MQYIKKYKPGGLVGRQGELDKNKDGKISGADFKMMGHGGKMDYMGYGGKMEYEMGGKSPFYKDGGTAPYKVPSANEIVSLQEEASKKAGKPMRYDAAFSKQQGKNMFVKAKHGSKMPEYAHGGMMQGQGGDVNALLEMLANYDQNASIGEFMQILAEMNSDQNRAIQEGLASGDGQLRVAPEGSFTSFPKEAGAAMRNLPPQDVESLLMQLGQQGR
jgi:hypothetical protein